MAVEQVEVNEAPSSGDSDSESWRESVIIPARRTGLRTPTHRHVINVKIDFKFTWAILSSQTISVTRQKPKMPTIAMQDLYVQSFWRRPNTHTLFQQPTLTV